MLFLGWLNLPIIHRFRLPNLKEVYIPREFVLHEASLRQAFAHCGIFVTAATRRCPDSVSVPMWPSNLSVRLPVAALVSRYLTN